MSAAPGPHFKAPPTTSAERSELASVMPVSRAARFAAVWLMGVGILLVGAFVWGFMERFREGFESGFDAMDGIVIVIFSTVAAAHIAAGVGVWRSHGWGALVGIVLAIIGLLFCALGSLEAWFMLLPVACYAGTLAGLVQATRLWQRQPPAA